MMKSFIAIFVRRTLSECVNENMNEKSNDDEL